MRLGDGRVSGIWLHGFHGYAPSRGFVVFTPCADGHTALVPWFLSHPMPLRITYGVCALLRFRFHGSRRIMEMF